MMKVEDARSYFDLTREVTPLLTPSGHALIWIAAILDLMKSMGPKGHIYYCYGPQWSWTEMVMGLADPGPSGRRGLFSRTNL